MASFPIAIQKAALPVGSGRPCPTCGLPKSEKGFIESDGVRDFCTDPFHATAAGPQLVEAARG